MFTIWAINGSRISIVCSSQGFMLSIVWAIYDNSLTIVWTIHDIRLTIVWVIQVYASRLTIVWTINDFLADHSKIICEVLQGYYGAIMWSDYDQPGRKSRTFTTYPSFTP